MQNLDFNRAQQVNELIKFRRSLIQQVKEGTADENTWEFLKENTKDIRKIYIDFYDNYVLEDK